MTNKLIKERVEEFRTKFGERIGMLELFYQNHGGLPYEGEIIPDWLVSALEEAEKRGREEMRNEIAEDLNKLKPGNFQLWLAELAEKNIKETI